jgi:hypothetical protein
MLPIAAQKFPRYFEGYLGFFTFVKNCYLFILRVLVELLNDVQGNPRVPRNPGLETLF